MKKVKDLRIAEKKDSLCCMTGNGGEIKLNEIMNGWARIVKHIDGSLTIGTSTRIRKFVEWVYEGEIKGGYDRFNGFGRLGINSKNKNIAVGYWSGFKRMSGKGIV